MQTERVTFLTSRDHKAALDAYATRTGQSVGHVVREATSQYIAEPSANRNVAEDEAALEVLTTELEAAVPQMRADLEAMRRDIAAANDAIEAYHREKAERTEPRAAA
jgi:outer membrane murein-binding lipoprotein Lpp